jgi:CheY-like chemotaxis protein
LKILYVEDDSFLRDLISDFLDLDSDDSGFKYELTLASNGEEGLDLYKNNEYDAIFTDVNMPKMNGIKMLEEVNKLNKNIPPIFIVTGYSENEGIINKSENELPKIKGIIHKPVVPSVLVDICKKISTNVDFSIEEMLSKVS